MTSKPIKKRINFYQIQAKETNDKGKGKVTLSKDEIRQYLESIYKKLKVNSKNYKYDHFQVGYNDYIIEFLKYDESMLFARIGKQANESTIGKRDTITGDLINIELHDSENIEAYTYLYLDLTNLILSYLVLSGSPSRTSFSSFINQTMDNIVFECVPITTDDVLERLANKEVLGTIEYAYCNPKENITKDIPGIDRKFLESLNAEKTVITVSLRPARSKSITNKIKNIFGIKNELMQTHGENLKSLRMNAKNHEEEAINYNLLDYNFASYAYISMLAIKTEEDFYNIITKEYKKMKSVLEDFTQ